MKKYFFIGILGAFGAIARYSFQKAPFSFPIENFPINTLLINILGCFILSFIIELSYEKKILGNSLRLGITTGFLGAFTTFSTLCKETTDLFVSGELLIGLGYVMLSIILGFAGIFGGYLLSKLATKKIASVNEGKIWN